MARLKALQTHQWRVLRNPKLRPSERIGIAAAVACIAEATAHEGKEVACVPLARVAEHSGMSESTAGKIVAKAATDDWENLLIKDVHRGAGAAYLWRNNKSGMVEERHGDLTYIGLTHPLIETLELAAALEPERPTHGGPRRKYICPDCPEADVLHVWQAVCSGCGAILDSGQHAYPNPDAADDSTFQDAPSCETEQVYSKMHLAGPSNDLQDEALPKNRTNVQLRATCFLL